MRARTLTFSVIASAAALLLVSTAAIGADDPEPKPKKKGGLLGAFSGRRDPSKERRARAPDDSDTEAEAPGAGPARGATPPLVHAVPDPKRIEARIRQLESMSYDDVEPVGSLDEAKRRINRLRRRAASLRLRADRRTVETINEIAARGDEVRARWAPVIAALNDGKKRSAREWAEAATPAVEIPNDPEAEPAPDAATPAAGAADRAVGLPTQEQLDAGPKPAEEEPAAEDEESILRPVEGPKPETKVAAPKLSDLVKAIEEQTKPRGMHPFTWARLVDSLERDRAELEVAAATARKRLREQREEEFAPVAETLRNAQRTYTDLKKLGDEPGEAMRRHLAYRIHQAELAQLRLAHNDLKALATERQGEKSDREPLVGMYPLDPARTLEDMMRAWDVNGAPGAPSPDAFDALKAGGLPDLYPEGSAESMDEGVHIGNLIKANIARYQRRLRNIRREMANVDETLRQEDWAAVQQLWSELRHVDRLAGKENHPASYGRRLVAVQKLYRDQRATRAGRVEARKAELQGRADTIVRRLEAEYKRRDAMLDKERAPSEETEPEGETPD